MTPSTNPFTLRSAAGLPSDPPDLVESILVIIDAQVEYSAEGALPLPDVDAATERISALTEAASATGAPIVHVVHQGKTGGLFDPDSGGRILRGAAPRDGERIISKSLPNAFTGTDLFEHVEQLQRRPLILVGFMTHMCVSSTARAALDLGLHTSVVSDATATRALPSTEGGAPLSADSIHAAALAALADRFSVVTDTASLVG